MSDLEKALGYQFNNKDLLSQALAHSSYINSGRANNLQSNERLEFLGDRVLGLVIAHKLYNMFDSCGEGVLAVAIAYLNSRETLYNIAESLNLPEHIRHLGIKNKKSLKSVYANALEAVLAAIYLDSNLNIVQEVIIKLWQPYIDNSMSHDIKLSFNPKSILQEWVQKHDLPLPIYEVINKEGTEHAPVFTVSLLVKGYPIVTGQANSKRTAQKNAAYKFITDNNILNHKCNEKCNELLT